MGFLRLWRPWGFSHEARRGPQGASRAAPGKSGLHALGEGERVMALESWERTRASRCVEEGLSRYFSGCGGKPSFPSPSAGDLRELPRVPLRSEGFCGVGVASRDSTGFGQCPRASCRGEAGSSGFLSVSDSNRRVPAELVQESQASSCVEEWNSTGLSSCSPDNRPLVELCVEPAVLSGRCMGVSVPLCFFAFIHRVAFEKVSSLQVLIKSRPGNQGLSACGTTHKPTSRISS